MIALYWLIGLAVLLLIEIITLGLTTIWFAGGALVAFIAAICGANIAVQIVLFVIVSLILLIFTRPIAMKRLNKNRVKTNYEGLIGKVVKITKTVDNSNQTGEACVNGQDWTVRSYNDDEIIEPGTKVKIVNIEGVRLIVTKYREEN
ncbi:MAG: NfeD family protein [Clostridiales bacterium]|nr:NfeD family protein [Clostridiales bacterium]